MKNKKGFLLAEETLKIIIALISISFLIYFLSSLYFAGKEKEELELAESSLNHLTDGIKSDLESVEIYNPVEWVLTSWPNEEVNNLPTSCSNSGWENCICLHEDLFILNELASSLPFSDNVAEKLRQEASKGICVESDSKVQNNLIKIENPPITLQITEGEINRI